MRGSDILVAIRVLARWVALNFVAAKDLNRIIRSLDRRYQRKRQGPPQGAVTESNIGSRPKVRLLGEQPGVDRSISYVGLRPTVGDTVYIEWVGAGNPLILGTIGETPWREVGDTDEPAFENSWVNFGGVEVTAAFRRVGDVVQIQGTVKSGTITAAVFTLPAEYRPSGDLIFATDTSVTTHARLDVESDGSVVAKTGSNAYYSLSPAWFVAGQ